MRKVLSYLKPYKLAVTIAYALTLIELIIELLLPFFLGKMINEGIVNEDLNNVIMWGSIMIGLALFSFICGIFNSFYASHASTNFSYDIRKDLFDKIQTFSFETLNMYLTSTFIKRISYDMIDVINTYIIIYKCK